MSEEHAPPSRTFTLRDLFVAVAVVAVLMGLVVMYLNFEHQDRLRKSRGSCRNNMKQLMLAMQNHQDAYKYYPALFFSSNPAIRTNTPLNPADAGDCYSWQMRILPFVEEDMLYKKISAASVKFTSLSQNVQIPFQNTQISPSALKLYPFQCASFPGDDSSGVCNYIALSATRLPLLTETELGPMSNRMDNPNLPELELKFKQPPDGLIVPSRAMRGRHPASVTDGTSKTAVLIESCEELRSNWYDPRQSFVVGFLPADTQPIDAAASNYYPYFDAERPAGAGTIPGRSPPPPPWHFNPATGDRTALASDVNNNGPKVPYHPKKGDPLERTWGPSSAHLGGIIMVGMADGSVREIKDDIDPQIFFSIITIAGGENLELPE